MHRHGYRGRKFHREQGERTALLKGLADSLVIYESIETTLPKAKELRPYMEKLISKAKNGDLHSRRLIISSLQTKAAAHKLVDEIAPKLSARSSGYLRIERTGFRRGDHAETARLSFVDDLKKEAKKAAEPKSSKAPAVKPAAKAKVKT